LRSADLFVLPCVRARDGATDVTPNSLLEAMALGLPVVSTTLAAIPEIVDDGVDGVLVPPGHAASLAAAMERLLADPALRRRLGDAARQKVRQRFDAARNAPARLAIFGFTSTSAGPRA
jgi:glycosyltransferase involved in cell wall biosynthesis